MKAIGVGGWVGAGVYWKVDSRVHLGLLVQYEYVPVHLMGRSLNAGGVEPLLMIGINW